MNDDGNTDRPDAPAPHRLPFGTGTLFAIIAASFCCVPYLVLLWLEVGAANILLGVLALAAVGLFLWYLIRLVLPAELSSAPSDDEPIDGPPPDTRIQP